MQLLLVSLCSCRRVSGWTCVLLHKNNLFCFIPTTSFVESQIQKGFYTKSTRFLMISQPSGNNKICLTQEFLFSKLMEIWKKLKKKTNLMIRLIMIYLPITCFSKWYVFIIKYIFMIEFLFCSCCLWVLRNTY